MSAIKRAVLFAYLCLALVANAVGGVYVGVCTDHHGHHSRDADTVACDDADHEARGGHASADNGAVPSAEEPLMTDDAIALHSDCPHGARCPPACLIACATAFSPALSPAPQAQAPATGLAALPPAFPSPAPDPVAGFYRPPRPGSI